jgi:hypothetical protein
MTMRTGKMNLPMTVGSTSRTSYNTRGGVHYGADGQPSADQSKAFRKNYAGLGYMYDAIVMLLFLHALTLLGYLTSRPQHCGNAPVAMPADAGTGEPPQAILVG